MENTLKKPKRQYTGKCKICGRIFIYSTEGMLRNNLESHENSKHNNKEEKGGKK